MGKLLINRVEEAPTRERIRNFKKWTDKSVMGPKMKVSKDWCEQIGKEVFKQQIK